MPWENIIRSFTLMVVLLNPFLLAVYLLPLIRELDCRTFMRVLARGGAISVAAFVAFAALGDAIFQDVLQVRFAAFLVFGGVVFILIALQFIFKGPDAIEMLRGEVGYVAGSIAMPFMIGPGTINASVLAGSRLPLSLAAATIAAAVVTAVVGLGVLKRVHDMVKKRNARLVSAYVDMVGRISALVIGAIAVEMIFQGLEQWIATMN